MQQQNNRWVQILVVLLVIIASAWLISQVWTFVLQFSNILYLFFVSWLLAFIMRPLAKWLASRGLSYGLAIAIVYLLLGVLLTVALVALIPVIVDQVRNFTDNFSSPEKTNKFIANGQAFLNSWGIPQLLDSWGIHEKELNDFYGQLTNFAQQTALGLLNGTVAFAQGLVVFFFQLILVLLLSFYFMKDGERISAGITNLLPPRWQDEMRLVAYSIERSFGGFIRGQLVFALVYAVLTAIVMIVPPFNLGDLALIASIAAGTCMLIPLVGNLLAFIPPVFALLITPDKAGLVFWFFGILFVMQSIMMNVLAPRIMSSAIGIHPMYVWAAILIGGQVAGIWGALFGIPIAGAVNLIGRPVMRRIRHTTSLYRDLPTSGVTTSAYLTGPLAEAMADGKISAASVPLDVLPDLGTTVTYSPSAVAQQLPDIQKGAAQAVAPTVTPQQAPATPARHIPAATMASTQTSMLPILPDEEEILVRPAPTLTAKAWRLTFVVLSRARKSAWERVQARVSARREP